MRKLFNFLCAKWGKTSLIFVSDEREPDRAKKSEACAQKGHREEETWSR